MTHEDDDVVNAACVLVERYGLDGREPRSLATVAIKYGLDRHAVRAIEARILVALKKAFEKGEKREAS